MILSFFIYYLFSFSHYLPYIVFSVFYSSLFLLRTKKITTPITSLTLK
jgi:hypothetical protein